MHQASEEPLGRLPWSHHGFNSDTANNLQGDVTGSIFASFVVGRVDSSFLDELCKVRLDWVINADDVERYNEYLIEAESLVISIVFFTSRDSFALGL
jgi:hypothetical protein